MSSSIKILFFGDVIGKPGRRALTTFLGSPECPEADLIIANVENAAHGFGVQEQHVIDLEQAGVHLFSGGNHTFDRKETLEFIDHRPNVLRPANYPEGTPGKGHALVDCDFGKIGVVNVQGRVFMEPLRSPFLIAEELVNELRKETNIILIDVHAEATAEKVAIGWYFDGKVSAVVGTHTHVQTADERILPGGTAYLTDTGCCGPINSVIGMSLEGVFRRMVKQLPSRLEVAQGQAAVNGVLITVDQESGKALDIERVRFLEPEGDYLH